MAQFLNKCKEDIEEEIHSHDYTKPETQVYIGGRVLQSNLLGIIINLPDVILKLKDELEKREEFANKMAVEQQKTGGY